MVDDVPPGPQPHVTAGDMIDVHVADRAEIDVASGRGDDGTRYLDIHVIDDLQRHALDFATVFHVSAGRHALRAGPSVEVRVELRPEHRVRVALPLQNHRGRRPDVFVEAERVLQLHPHDVIRGHGDRSRRGAGGIRCRHGLPETRVSVISRAKIDARTGADVAVGRKAHPDDVADGRLRQELLVSGGQTFEAAGEIEVD